MTARTSRAARSTRTEPRRALAALALATLAGGALAGGEPVTPPAAAGTASLDAVLAAVVRDGAVDYAAVRDRHLPALDAWLTRHAAPGALDGLERDEHLATLINVYNATVLREVATRLAEPGYSVEQDGFALFKTPLVRLAGQTISLDTLEHERIRKGFDEPRIHAALVCAARSCPPLLERAFRGDDLDAALDRQMRVWLGDPGKNRADHDARTLHLSSIFDWYAEDFGGRERLAAWVDPYFERDVSGYAVEFLDYSWAPNIAR